MRGSAAVLIVTKKVAADRKRPPTCLIFELVSENCLYFLLVSLRSSLAYKKCRHTIQKTNDWPIHRLNYQWQTSVQFN